MARTARKPSKAPIAPAVPGERLIPPPGGAVIRMYRIGHGDCFLIAIAGSRPDEPCYVLIDCGYKPGSPSYIKTETGAATTVREITANIRAATGGRLHAAVVTHEHQDHVNGISDATFEGIAIDEAWFAWTEDPDDPVANALREKFRDRLVGLVAARDRLERAGTVLGAASDAGQRIQKQVADIDDLLAFELGGEDGQPDLAVVRNLLTGTGNPFGAAAASRLGESANKRAMAVFKKKARRVRFIKPHETVPLPGAEDVRVYSLGPPRDPDLLHSSDPSGREEFHAMAAVTPSAYVAAAAASQEVSSPFAPRYSIPLAQAAADATCGEFFRRHYGQGGPGGAEAPFPDKEEAPGDAPWRRIETDWLQAAGQMALAMNDDTNNASLVLAFELGASGKVLLFVGDAQRGNWVSWSRADWPDRSGTGRITARDLLARTVLYKVGHHGSHNATLNGDPGDDYPNLSWIGTKVDPGEFTAMITAVRAWAETQKGWDHPLKAIKDALLKKAAGRVLQTDTDLSDMHGPAGATGAWDAFLARTGAERLYFDMVVQPD